MTAKRILKEPTVEWKKKGESLARAKWSNQWKIAAWMLKGEDNFKRKQREEVAVKATGMTVETLRQFAHTARNVLTRVNGLSFGHHRLVAQYTPEQQARYLKHAKDTGKSVEAFAAYLKTLKQDAELETESPADVAASKVIEACNTLLRNYHFDTLIDERPSQSACTKVLDRLKSAIHELGDKVKQMETAWGVKAKGAGAGK
jgi:hypothetical protein